MRRCAFHSLYTTNSTTLLSNSSILQLLYGIVLSMYMVYSEHSLQHSDAFVNSPI